MDELLTKLRSFPPQPAPSKPLSDRAYEEAARAHVAAMGKCSDKLLLQHNSSGESALAIIPPDVHTISFVFVLLAHLSSITSKGKGPSLEKLWPSIEACLLNFDGKQMRYLGKEYNTILDATFKYASSSDEPSVVMVALQSAILRLDPTGSLLTSTHLRFVKLALENGEYKAALPVIDKYIFQFPGAVHHPKPAFICEEGLPPVAYITPTNSLTGKLKYNDVLEYFICCGMVYIGLQKWESALESLENAITYPAREVSKIMVEAYKKWVLVGLLIEGKLLPLPRNIGPNAAKIYHTIGKPYEAVAQIFESGTASRLKSEIEVGQKEWQKDCNTGLIINILSGYQKFQIRHLANVYSKISIQEVHHVTTSAETGTRLQSPALVEQLVRSMIADGSLDASLSNPPSGPAILTFATNKGKLPEAQVEKELDESKARLRVLLAEIKRTDHMLTYDKEYLKFVQRQKQNAKNGAMDQGIAGPDMDWNSLEDEDIMAGVTY